MKKVRLVMMTLMMSLFLFSCEKEVNSTTNQTPTNCGWYNGKPTYKGSNGGCYYINSNGNKTYVDAQYCPC